MKPPKCILLAFGVLLSLCSSAGRLFPRAGLGRPSHPCSHPLLSRSPSLILSFLATMGFDFMYVCLSFDMIHVPQYHGPTVHGQCMHLSLKTPLETLGCEWSLHFTSIVKDSSLSLSLYLSETSLLLLGTVTGRDFTRQKSGDVGVLNLESNGWTLEPGSTWTWKQSPDWLSVVQNWMALV